MSILKFAAVGAATLALFGTAQAQTLSIGSTQGGAVGQITTTLAKLV